MADESTGNVERRYVRAWRRLSWGGIFAGTIAALVIYLTLNLLGLGIGAATIDIQEGDTPTATGFGVGAGIWWVIAGILSLFAGGWIAARFALVPNKMDRALHGIVVWGLTSLVIVLTLTTAMGSIIGGAANVIAQTGQGAAQQPQLLEQLQGVLPTQEGEQQQVQQQAAEAADQAATAVATAAIWMFVSMLLMAAAAAWGGTIAKGPEYVEERRGEAGQWHERAA